MKTSVLFTIALIFLFSPTVFAKPYCNVTTQKKLYRLELTVPAAFCRSAEQNDPSCQSFPKESVIQLHGLWPNYMSGFPEGTCEQGECEIQNEEDGKYCKYPEPPNLYASELWKNYQGYMAGTEKCLERHEWVKHGTCSPMSAVEYFNWSLKTTKHIVTSLGIEPDMTMTRAEFESRIKRKLPELNGAIRLTCKQEMVTGMYVLYKWGQKPGAPIKTKSGVNSYGNCPQNFIFVSKKS